MQTTTVSLSDLAPIGFRKDGRPILPIMGGAPLLTDPDPDDGGDEDNDADADPDGQEPDGETDADDSDSDDPKSWDKERTLEEVRKRNTENAKLRARTKAAEEAAAKWAEYQKSLLSKEERLAAEAAEKGSTAATLADENNRLRVRLETGLTERQVARLVGSTFEELLEDAEAFKADLPAAPAEKEAPARKTPPGNKLKGGLNPADDEDTEMDPFALADRAMKARPSFF